LFIQASLCLSFRHIYLKWFHGYTTANEHIMHSQKYRSFMKFIYSSYSAHLNSHLFLSIWQMHNIWAIFDLLCWNPNRWFHITSFTCDVNLRGEFLAKFCMLTDLVQLLETEFLHIKFLHCSFTYSLCVSKFCNCQKVISISHVLWKHHIMYIWM
jgi:hypothetical protein